MNMKLLFIIHSISGGGAEKVLVTLANEMVSQNIEVFILTDCSQEPIYSVDGRIKLVDLFEGCTSRNIWSSVRMRYNIRKVAKNISPDVIIAFMSKLGCTTVIATLGLQIPVIISEHTNVSRKLGYVHSIRRCLIYPLASCVTVLTHNDYLLWKDKFSNVVRMPNPIDLMHVKPHKRNKVVLAVGRVNQWDIKGFDNLLISWSYICHDFPEWQLCIAGAGNQDSIMYLEAIAEKYKCVNYRFLGFRKDIFNLMYESEIFCLSSRVEGLPMALLEAMNAGCCCVSFNVPTGPNEIIKNMHSGLIADNQNTVDLADKLRAVMLDDDLRSKLASNTMQSIQKYDLPNVIRRWNILFKKLVAKNSF